MADVPREVSNFVRLLAGMVRESDVSKDSELAPHITVLYGLHTSNPTEIHQHLLKFRSHLLPIPFRVGSLSLFQNKEHDVLKLGVDSPLLHELNEHFRQLPCTITFSDYTPHITVGYLQPGTGSRYLQLMNPLMGERLNIQNLIFSDTEGYKHWMPLGRPSVQDAVEMIASWGHGEMELAEMLTAMAVGTRPMPMGFVRPLYPEGRPRKARKPVANASTETEG